MFVCHAAGPSPKARAPRSARRLAALSLVAALAAAGCTPATGTGPYNDPYEAQNRKVHDFNVALDKTMFGGGTDREKGPGLPEPVARGLTNFADNLDTPGAALNSALQGRVEPFVVNVFRFLVNTTVGFGGLLDPATEFGLPRRETDFGETLHVWGADEGAYLVVPLLGPTTERDLAGKVVDALIDPLGAAIPEPEKYGVSALKFGAKIVKRQRFSNSVDSVLHESADSYAQTRLIYLQNRRFELGGPAAEESGAMDPYADPYADPYEDPYASQ